MAQLGFFSERTGRPELEPGSLAEETAELAQQLPPALRLGTMSWTFPGWIGRVYGPHTKPAQLAHSGLSAYVKQPLLRTVELDSSYYQPPTLEQFQSLASQVPDNFRFVVKAHNDCTAVVSGNSRLLEPGYATERVIAPYAEGLKEKGALLLFQFSPFTVRHPKRFADKLFAFLSRLPKGPRYAVELRNTELLTDAYGKVLAETGAVHCFNAWVSMPDVLSQRERLAKDVRKTLLARWVTRPNDKHADAEERYAPFDSLKEEDEPRRDELANLVNDALGEGSDVYVLINNKAEGCAPESIRKLAQAIETRRRKAQR